LCEEPRNLLSLALVERIFLEAVVAIDGNGRAEKETLYCTLYTYLCPIR
jgi:hypothetical protein